jgi:E1A-binding protein p400
MNAFHVCITSYKLVIQDHASFRRKKWKYFILDEAQNIKNFKSQRWQALLNFQSQRRLLLTGTPLQNNLMELWSLMHFLMPHVFSSHREFQHWFSNPLKCMIEGNQEYNEQLIRRLHKVLRPFILRRLKIDVEKQMPKKYEHVISCHLSKRQRLLYNEFMSLSSTKSVLSEGHYMSVINILMQLRKVCNHPDLFDPRPIVSSFVVDSIQLNVPSIVFNLTEDVFSKRSECLMFYEFTLPDMELHYSAFGCHRAKQLQVTRKQIEAIMLTDEMDQECEQKKETTNHVDESSFFIDSTLHGYNIVDSPVHSPSLQRAYRNSSTSKSRNANIKIRNKINYLLKSNKQRCSLIKPLYGSDLQHCLGR